MNNVYFLSVLFFTLPIVFFSLFPVERFETGVFLLLPILEKWMICNGVFFVKKINLVCN